MKRGALSLFLLALAALPARAHFIWLLPGEKGAVRLVFSDTPTPDENANLLSRVARSKAFAGDAKGEVTPVKFKKSDKAFALSLEGDSATVFATCTYGIFKRGDAEPSLLNYYAKTWIHSEKGVAKVWGKPTDKLDLDISFTRNLEQFRVTWKGKPLARVKVFLTSGKERWEETTDEQGAFNLEKGKMKIGKGLIAIRVGHTVKEEGEYKGQKYTTIRHWATLTFEPRILQLEPDRERESPVSAPAVERKENTEATKLLADARAARANWEGFTGFTADLEVNVEGKVTRGKIDVDHKGKVTLEGIEDKTLEGW